MSKRSGGVPVVKADVEFPAKPISLNSNGDGGLTSGIIGDQTIRTDLGKRDGGDFVRVQRVPVLDGIRLQNQRRGCILCEILECTGDVSAESWPSS
jgi:hypothetical protein